MSLGEENVTKEDLALAVRFLNLSIHPSCIYFSTLCLPAVSLKGKDTEIFHSLVHSPDACMRSVPGQNKNPGGQLWSPKGRDPCS